LQAPILLGNDLTQLDAPTLAILTNAEALAVHQARPLPPLHGFIRSCVTHVPLSLRAGPVGQPGTPCGVVPAP